MCFRRSLSLSTNGDLLYWVIFCTLNHTPVQKAQELFALFQSASQLRMAIQELADKGVLHKTEQGYQISKEWL